MILKAIMRSSQIMINLFFLRSYERAS